MMSLQQQQQQQQAFQLHNPFAAGVPHLLIYQPALAPLPANHGPGPAGTLTITANAHTVCPGYEALGSTVLELSYDIPSGTQQAYHPHPGAHYSGTRRTAYLPDSFDGRQLLTRMKVAWLRGWSFKIGVSLTTGRDNQVCWTEIPHKTDLKGGPFSFGFPDHNYVPKANSELDKKGIPNADTCLMILQQQQQQQQQNGGGGPTANYLPQQNQPVPSTFRTAISSMVPSFGASGAPSGTTRSSSTISLNETLTYTAPVTLAVSFKNVIYRIPATATGWDGEDCAICLEKLHASEQNLEQIGTCLHVLHKDCLEDCLQKHPKCPVCRTPIGGEPQGKGPSGTMSIQTTGQTCPGFPGCDTISIQYNIPSGVQLGYHDHPGQRYSGAQRTAYLPNNKEGQDLLLRLKYAWLHGLIFRVGTSLTSGATNQTTWTSIHHKTSLHGGPHGFPDANYMGNCNASLDALHVPPVDELRKSNGTTTTNTSAPVAPPAAAAAAAPPTFSSNAPPAAFMPSGLSASAPPAAFSPSGFFAAPSSATAPAVDVFAGANSTGTTNPFGTAPPPPPPPPSTAPTAANQNGSAPNPFSNSTTTSNGFTNPFGTAPPPPPSSAGPTAANQNGSAPNPFNNNTTTSNGF